MSHLPWHALPFVPSFTWLELVLLVVVAMTGFGVAAPKSAVGLVLAPFVSIAGMFGIVLWISAIVRTEQAAWVLSAGALYGRPGMLVAAPTPAASVKPRRQLCDLQHRSGCTPGTRRAQAAQLAGTRDDERPALGRPDDPAASYTGRWWSSPAHSRLPVTTRGLPSLGASAGPLWKRTVQRAPTGIGVYQRRLVGFSAAAGGMRYSTDRCRRPRTAA
jgi:hypothetical protein